MSISDKWIIKWYYENIEKVDVMKKWLDLTFIKDLI